MNNHGFSLLIVLLIIAFLSFITFNIWYKSSLLFDLVVAREQFYKNYYLTEACFNYILDFVKKDFDKLIIEKKWPIQYDFSFLLENINEILSDQYSKFHLQAILNKKTGNKKLYVFVNLYKKGETNALCSLGCKLKRILTRDNNANKQKEKKIFTIKNYTIGTII